METIANGRAELDSCIFENVLYVSNLRQNLMSIHLITRKGGKIMFLKHNVIVYKKEEKILVGKTCVNGFYGADELKGKIQARVLLVERNKKLVVVQKIEPSKYRKHEKVVQEIIGNKSNEMNTKGKNWRMQDTFSMQSN
ncbi:hypothetical protein WN48_02184 [Eufriesea mexicana]|uniref:Uncharacterized protein n=1 Tax=Eufriesea mexicana TaxID=516756 RepID=A0A310SFX2_9HYME|nr:hypothetical protein WN48_02184 [Eufriesea mexicana]